MTARNEPMLQAANCELHTLYRAQDGVSGLILRTKTGPAREELTEANIHMMLAIDKLRAAAKLFSEGAS